MPFPFTFPLTFDTLYVDYFAEEFIYPVMPKEINFRNIEEEEIRFED